MYTEDWFSRHIPYWDDLLTPMKGKPIQAIEIGSFEGRSAVWLCENILTHDLSHLDSIDPYLPYLVNNQNYNFGEETMGEVEKRFYENTKKYRHKITTHKMLSADYLKGRTEMADLIYIDGDHTEAGCLTDAVLSHQLLRSGGIMIFDDYLWDGLSEDPDTPKGAINAFMKCYSKQYDWMLIGYQVFLKRR